MDTKFTILRHETQIQIQPYCPVLLVASAITRNNLNGHIFAQYKFRNISNQKITKLSIKIHISDLESGEKWFEFLYPAVMASSYENFGDTVPIPLADESIDVTGISIEKIQFDHGQIWINENYGRFMEAVQRKRIADQLEGRLYSQYEKEIKKLTEVPIELVGVKDFGLVFCGCGNIYPQEYEKCPKCRTSLNDQIRICSPEFLEHRICHEQELQVEKKRKKREKTQKTIAPIKRHPWIAAACLSGTVCASAAVFFAITIGMHQYDSQTRNPLSIDSIDTSQTWSAMGKNFYQIDVSADTTEPFAAIFTKTESNELQFVYLENGTGILKSDFAEKPSALPQLLGYVTGQKADAAMVSTDVRTGPQESDLYSHTAIIDFSLDPQYGKDGIVLFNLYDGLSGKAKTNQYVPIVDGKGSISYPVDDSVRVADGTYDTPLAWREKIATKITAEPIFFISSAEIADTDYTSEDDISYTFQQKWSSESELFDFRNYQGEQHFALQGTFGLPKGMQKIFIYKDEDLNDNETIYKVCRSNGNTVAVESYDFVGDLNFTPEHVFSLISLVPLRSVGSTSFFQSLERRSLDETKEVFQEEHQNLSDLIGDIEETVTYYSENEIKSQKALESFQKGWLQYSDVAYGIQQRLLEKLPPVEYEADWKAFANSIQEIAEDLKMCSTANFDNVNQGTEGSSPLAVGLDQFVQHCYDAIDAQKNLQQALNVDLDTEAG